MREFRTSGSVRGGEGQPSPPTRQRLWTASLTLRQVLAEGAFAAHTIRGLLVDSRRHGAQQIRLDIIEAATLAYFNVLKAQTLERIHKANVRMSRSNLDLAHKRLAIGAARISEVYRWEAEIARQRQNVISAHLTRSVSALELNRLLRRPLEEAFVLSTDGLAQPVRLDGHRDLRDVLDNPRSMRAFRDFMAEQSIAQAPELAQLQRAIAVQERTIETARRSFWVPTLALEGKLEQTLADGGEGTSGFELPAQFGSSPPPADDTNWHLVASLTWPLIEGGSGLAELDRHRAELTRLQLEHAGATQRIEQRLRMALQRSRASAANIALSRAAAVAARKSLDLVAEAYARGAVGLLDLLDGQNTALISELAAANAEFDFLSDFIKTQRASGGFHFLISPEEKRAWAERLLTYLKAKDALPSPRRSRADDP